MFRVLIISCVAGASVTSAFAQPSPPAKTFAVKLFRPLKPRDRYRLKVVETRKQQLVLSRNGKPQQTKSKTTRVKLDAEVTVLKVDEQGHPLKLAIAIKSFVDGQKNELLKAGKTVFAETIEGKTVFRLPDGPLPSVVARRLGSLIKTKLPDSPDDDAVFGSKQRRAIGERWKVDAGGVARAFNVDPKTVKGFVTLKAIENMAGVAYQQFAIDIEIASFPDARKFQAGGYTIREPSIVARQTASVPADNGNDNGSRDSHRAAQVSVKATMVGNTPELKGVELKLSGEWATETTRTFQK